ncbi:MAG: hypothetical protein ACK4P5_01425 [Fimbriimonadales bacterium]
MRSACLEIEAIRHASVSRVAGWVQGMALALMMGAFFSLVEPSPLFWVVGVVLLMGWSIWAWSQPLPAFGTLIFVWVTFYTRASLPLFQVESGWNRGGVGLGDLLWSIYIGMWLYQVLRCGNGRLFALPQRVDSLLLLILPYLLLSVFLPVAGVLAFGYPPSYAIPGIRHLQWASFALLGYWFCRRYGIESMIWTLLFSFTAAGVIHALYALIQLLTPLGVLPQEWLLPDRVFAERYATTWFFYPRTTGLLVNPNSYGLFGSVALILLSALLLSGMRIRPRMVILLGSVGLWAIATSASRSAIVGLLAGVILMGITALLKGFTYRNEHHLYRLVGFLLKIPVAVAMLSIAAWLFLPHHLTDRIMLLVGVVVEGAEVDPNAIGRFNFWEQALRLYEERAPLGTWVPAGYAFNIPIDSYYVSLITQGTPLYLFAFLMLLFGVVGCGWQVWMRVRENTQSEPKTCQKDWIGLALMGIGALIGAASFTLSPLQAAQTLVPFWLLIGIGLASKQ